MDLASRAERSESGSARLIWYATLALLRCVASSPAAAEKALSTRLEGTLEDKFAGSNKIVGNDFGPRSGSQRDEPRGCGEQLGPRSGPQRGESHGWDEQMEALAIDPRLYDGHADDLSADDLEPPTRLGEADRFTWLIEEARGLAGSPGDPKFAALIEHLDLLLRDGFRPVVFCRYVARRTMWQPKCARNSRMPRSTRSPANTPRKSGRRGSRLSASRNSPCWLPRTVLS